MTGERLDVLLNFSLVECYVTIKNDLQRVCNNRTQCSYQTINLKKQNTKLLCMFFISMSYLYKRTTKIITH